MEFYKPKLDKRQEHMLRH